MKPEKNGRDDIRTCHSVLRFSPGESLTSADCIGSVNKEWQTVTLHAVPGELAVQSNTSQQSQNEDAHEMMSGQLVSGIDGSELAICKIGSQPLEAFWIQEESLWN